MAYQRSNLLWAVDPFNDDPKLLAAALCTAHNWSRHRAGEIIPVYVLSSRQVGLAYEFEFDSPDFIATRARDRFRQLLRNYRISRIRDLQVIYTRSWSLLHAVQVLQEYADKCGAEGILISTHGRGGLKRAFLGSFAEASLLQARVPIMTVNPNVSKSTEVRSILFPTEFGRFSNRVFTQILQLAQARKASLCLLHILPNLSGITLLGGVSVYPPLFPYNLKETLAAQKSYVKRRFEAWMRRSSKMGVSAEYSILDAKGSIADAILSFARQKGTQLISLESESGRTKSALLGSVCRNVVRNSACPVWAIRGALAYARPRRHPRLAYEILTLEDEASSLAA